MTQAFLRRLLYLAKEQPFQPRHALAIINADLCHDCMAFSRSTLTTQGNPFRTTRLISSTGVGMESKHPRSAIIISKRYIPGVYKSLCLIAWYSRVTHSDCHILDLRWCVKCRCLDCHRLSLGCPSIHPRAGFPRAVSCLALCLLACPCKN